ncbi:uncharacterized protein ACBT57_009605 [Dama dama]
MAAAALARIRAVGLRARLLAPKVPRQLSLATNYLGSHSASRCIKVVERSRKRFSERGSRLSISGLPLPAGKGPGLRLPASAWKRKHHGLSPGLRPQTRSQPGRIAFSFPLSPPSRGLGSRDLKSGLLLGEGTSP